MNKVGKSLFVLSLLLIMLGAFATGALAANPVLSADKPSPQNLNTTIKFTVVDTEPAAVDHYTYQIVKDWQWVYQSPNETANYFNYQFTTSGTYKIYANVYYKDGRTPTTAEMYYVINNTEAPPTINTINLGSPGFYYVNQPARISVDASGGNLQYSIKVDKTDGTYSKLYPQATENFADVIFPSAGDYHVTVTCSNSAGSDTEIFAANAVDPLNIVSITTDKSSPQVLNTPITWTANYTGGLYQNFNFSLYKDGLLITSGNTNSNTFTYTPTIAGNYQVKVVAIDPMLKPVELTSDTFLIEHVIVKSLTASKVSPQKPNTIIRWTSDALGANLTYSFQVYKSGVLQSTTAFSSLNYFDWKPTKAGTYTVKVTVKNTQATKTLISSSFVIN